MIKLLAVIVLALNLTSCGGKQENNFYTDSHKAIDIVEERLIEITSYKKKDNDFLQYYFDKKGYSSEQADFTHRLMKISFEYAKQVNFRYREDPKNFELTDNLLKETKVLRKELETKFKE